MSEPVLIAKYNHKVGEGPLWHPDERCIYWVDIPTGRLFRYDPETKESEQVLSIDRAIGGYTIQADGTFALFTGQGGVALWTGGDDDIEYIIDSIPGEENSRFNDVIADPMGRVFAGTMPTNHELGSLYRIDPDGSYELVDTDGYQIPNGMALTPDRKTLYVTESEAHTIHKFDYDQATGTLSGKKTYLQLPEKDAVPDGMTVDEENHVWSAQWNGHRLVRYDPDSAEPVTQIDFQIPKVSSITFGGDNYDELYVTTAKGHNSEDAPPAGSLFRIDADVRGVPEFRSRIGWG